jgi:hypothetical protein
VPPEPEDDELEPLDDAPAPDEDDELLVDTAPPAFPLFVVLRVLVLPEVPPPAPPPSVVSSVAGSSPATRLHPTPTPLAVSATKATGT